MALWKKLLLISFSIGAGAVIAIVTVLSAWYWYDRRPGPAKNWTDTKIESLNLKGSLQTKWRNGRMQFQLRLAPDNETGMEAFHRAVSSSRTKDGVTILFQDSSGFDVCEIPIPDSDFTRKIDSSGRFVALAVNSSGYCSRGDYEEAANWSIRWNSLPDATPPKTVAIPTKRPATTEDIAETQPKPTFELKPPRMPDKWKNKSNWRKLANGMSQEEVRALLGEPTRVEGGTIEYWYYGPGGMRGAYVTFSGNRLYGWREP